MTDNGARQGKEDDVTIMLEHEHDLRDIVRSVHDDLDLPEGYRAEIIGGQIALSASPFGKHAAIVNRVRRAVDPALPNGIEVFENTTLEEPETDRYIPDLAAWPFSLMDEAEEEWIFPASECVFALEVTSPKQEARDYIKADGYAHGGVLVYLLVDRKARKCIVYTDPTPDGYATQHTVPFGDPLTVTFEGGGTATIDTSDF